MAAAGAPSHLGQAEAMEVEGSGLWRQIWAWHGVHQELTQIAEAKAVEQRWNQRIGNERPSQTESSRETQCWGAPGMFLF